MASRDKKTKKTKSKVTIIKLKDLKAKKNPKGGTANESPEARAGRRRD